MTSFLTIEAPDEVIRAARTGDRRAYEEIYRACRRPVYTLIRRIVCRGDVAEELFQDTLVEVLRNLTSYSGEGAFGGWVRAIAVNKCLAYLRSPWRRALLSLDGAEDALNAAEATDPALLPDQDAEAHSLAALALARLPPLARTVVWLHDVEGYTHGEIALALGRSVSFSKSQLARAHARMRALLEPSAEPLPCTPASTTC